MEQFGQLPSVEMSITTENFHGQRLKDKLHQQSLVMQMEEFGLPHQADRSTQEEAFMIHGS